MMLRIILISFFYFIQVSVFCQEEVISEEKFKDNSNNWLTIDNLDGLIKIQNRTFIIEPKNAPGLIARHEVKIDPNRDFSVSCSTIWTGNTENDYFGLTWGANANNKDYFFFGITANGLYSNNIFTSNKWSFPFLNAPTEYINKKGNNKIEIKKVGSIINFYINDNKVNEAKFEPLFGDGVGFYVSSKQQIIFDDLKVSYDEKQIITDKIAPVFSKENVIFEENFKDNFNNWVAFDDLSGLIKIKNNSYSIEPKNSPALIARQEVKIDPSRDFSISSSTVWNSGISNNVFGLSWGGSDSKNFHVFGITADGIYGYEINSSDVWSRPIARTPSIYINKKGNNKIEIKKVGSIIKFYINENKVNEAKFEPFFGDKVGFYVSSKQQIIFNNLKISYDERQIILDNIGPEITITEPITGRGVTIDDSEKQVLIKGKATDISGIYEVIINGNTANLNANGDFEQKINLAVGNNLIKVEAKDTKNNIGSYSFYLNGKEKVFNEITNNDAPINKIEKRLALVIGNANYEGGSAKLKNPLNDAILMSSTLENLGFEVIKRFDANKQSMEDAIREFSRKLPNFNVALFYYAGHGVQVDGMNWFIPIGAKLNEKTDCKFEAISVNFVVEEFEKYPDNVNLVILDACRSNPFRGWSRGGDQGFKAINPTRGTIISYATSEGSTASDGVGENGLFTKELVKQMNIPQSIESVFKKTRVQVLKISNGGQSPQEWTQLTGDFYFKK